LTEYGISGKKAISEEHISRDVRRLEEYSDFQFKDENI
jgi:hypothetical protein